MLLRRRTTRIMSLLLRELQMIRQRRMSEHHTIKASMLIERASDLEAEACGVEWKKGVDGTGWTGDAEVRLHDGVFCCGAGGFRSHFGVVVVRKRSGVFEVSLRVLVWLWWMTKTQVQTIGLRKGRGVVRRRCDSTMLGHTSSGQVPSMIQGNLKSDCLKQVTQIL